MAHHHPSHLKTEQDYRLRLAQLKQAIAALKSQIERDNALIQDFKSPANILLALAAGHHRRQSLSEIAQARQRLTGSSRNWPNSRLRSEHSRRSGKGSGSAS